jgi:hypothetical protein
MLLTMKNNDRYSFLSTTDLSDKKHLKNYRREFLSHMESRLHDEYDRGYFEAWSDYMKILPRIEAPASFNNNKNHTKQDPNAGRYNGYKGNYRGAKTSRSLRTHGDKTSGKEHEAVTEPASRLRKIVKTCTIFNCIALSLSGRESPLGL